MKDIDHVLRRTPDPFYFGWMKGPSLYPQQIQLPILQDPDPSMCTDVDINDWEMWATNFGGIDSTTF